MNRTEQKVKKLKADPYHYFQVMFMGGVDQGIAGILDVGTLTDAEEIIRVMYPCVVKTEGQSNSVHITDKQTFGDYAEFRKSTVGGISDMSESLRYHYATWAYDTRLVGGVNDDDE